MPSLPRVKLTSGLTLARRSVTPESLARATTSPSFAEPCESMKSMPAQSSTMPFRPGVEWITSRIRSSTASEVAKNRPPCPGPATPGDIDLVAVFGREHSRIPSGLGEPDEHEGDRSTRGDSPQAEHDEQR